MKKKVSVVMCVYNEPSIYVKESLESLLNQSYGNIEIIIINDNPKDIILNDLILGYKDQRIRYYRNDLNLGITKSLNKGIRLCKGDYLAKMDADDICHIDRFKIQLNFLDANKTVFMVGSYANYIDSNGNKIGEIKHRLDFDQIKIDTLFESVFIHPTVLYRIEVFKDHKLFYNEEFFYASDYEMWTRLVHKFECVNIPEFLLNYRKSDNQISTGKVFEQTDFFMKALINQLENLGINLSIDQQDLIRLVTRNLNKVPYNSSNVKEFSFLLENMFKELVIKDLYNTELLKVSFLKKQVNLLRYYKGKSLIFYKELYRLKLALDTSFKSSIKILFYILKLKMILKLK